MFSHYQSLVQIVESNTLVLAAKALHTTQPTLTRQVQQMEEEFGVKLFDRVGKRLVLNQAGELVYQYAKQFVALERRLQDELAGFMNPEMGLIRIGAGLTPSIYLLPQLFALYRMKHPGVQFQVISGSSETIFEKLHAGEIDLGIVTTLRQSIADVSTMALLRDELLVVAPNGHPLVGRVCDLLQIAKYPVVLMGTGSGLRKIVDDLAELHGIAWNIVTETDSLESMSRFVQNGMGLSVMPRSAVQDDLGAGRLREIAVADVELGARTITLIQRVTGHLPAVATRFAQSLPRLVKS